LPAGRLAHPAAHLLGISYGGEVVQAFSLRYPERALSLILADTVSELDPQLQLVGECWLRAAQAADPDLFYSATAPWNFSAEFIATHTELLAAARQRYALLDYPAVCRLMEAFLQVNFTARLGEIKQPVCILVGEKDILKGLPYARLLKEKLPQAELHILKGAGHASSWEDPAEFNSIVLGFLAKNL
jgi:pimeloyl-ACP methyl ester carboxylesterase